MSEAKTGMLFIRCPKCQLAEQWIDCNNCGKFDEFVNTAEGAKCSCEVTIKFRQCSCGANVAAKFLFSDEIKQAQIFQKAKLLADEKNAAEQASFGLHYIAWTFLLLLIGEGFAIYFVKVMYSDEPRFSDSNALGVMANRSQDYNIMEAGLTAMGATFFAVFLVSWLPSVLTYNLSLSAVRKKMKEKKILEAKPG